MAKWNFKTQRPGDTTREPIQGEFFSTDAISNTAEALVREGIQNSLDAGREGETVKVRIFISGPENALPAEKLKPYLDGAWPHLQARQNGLRNAPAVTDPCPYLVFEDFGTTGLGGDPAQWHKIEGTKNGFFTFFRAEGQSDKEEGDRGRWGVGKFVFPRSSHISTFWGVTIRALDSKRLLMGRSILKSHAINGDRHVPDGYFGKPLSVGEVGEMVIPFDEKEMIDAFCTDFGLTRAAQPGLSLVVPWYVTEEITTESVLQAVIQGYFYPILAGDLVVTVADATRQQELTAETLIEIVGRIKGGLAAEMVPLIELAIWGKGIADGQRALLNRPSETGALHWQPSLMPEGIPAQLRKKLQTGERLAVRVPYPVRAKKDKGTVRWSFFDVYLVRDGSEERGRPVFVREGIIISDVHSPYCRGIRALVVIEDGPLAAMLGDSENPAHTQWQKASSNYEGKYLFGPSNLDFVIRSVSEIVKLITEADREADKNILVDIFSLPADPEDPDAVNAKGKEKEGKRPGKKSLPPPDPPKPTPKRFKVEKVQEGFRVLPGDADAPLPRRLRVRVAYATRRGNPLNQYHPADFKLDKKPIIVEKKGMTVTFSQGDEKSGKELRADVSEKDFLLAVTGFDENRDLFVDVRVPQEETDDDQADELHGPERINRKDVRISLHEKPGEPALFDVDLSNLGEYKLPGDALVFVEARLQTRWMRFPFGTVGAIKPVPDRRLTEFDSTEGIQFSVKVTSVTGRAGLMLAEAEGIPVRFPGEVEERRSPLLPVKPDDLGHEVYRVDFSDSPVLLVNRMAADKDALARSPLFMSLVYPAALREILNRILRVSKCHDADDQDCWEGRWLKFAMSLPGLGNVPEEDEDHRFDDWIDDAVAAFARQQGMLDRFITGWQKGGI